MNFARENLVEIFPRLVRVSRILAGHFFSVDSLEMLEQCRAQGASEPEFVLIRNVEFRTIFPRDMLMVSFEAAYIAGAELNIDGGILAGSIVIPKVK